MDKPSLTSQDSIELILPDDDEFTTEIVTYVPSLKRKASFEFTTLDTMCVQEVFPNLEAESIEILLTKRPNSSPTDLIEFITQIGLENIPLVISNLAPPQKKRKIEEQEVSKKETADKSVSEVMDGGSGALSQRLSRFVLFLFFFFPFSFLFLFSCFS